jgi:hypothetical protein
VLPLELTSIAITAKDIAATYSAVGGGRCALRTISVRGCTTTVCCDKGREGDGGEEDWEEQEHEWKDREYGEGHV